MTYNEFKNQVIKNRIGIKNNDIQFRCMLYLYKIPLTGKSNRDSNWMNKPIDYGLYSRYSDNNKLVARIKEQVVWEATERRKRDKLKPFNKELINDYFKEVNKFLK